LELAIDPELQVALTKRAKRQAVQVYDHMVEAPLAIFQISVGSGLHWRDNLLTIGINEVKLDLMGAFFACLKAELQSHGARRMIEWDRLTRDAVKSA